MASNTSPIPAHWFPTGTAWRTTGGELVQIYRQGTGGWCWCCEGCLNYGPQHLKEKAPELYNQAQTHADTCTAIQV